jgi:hypothetical protein
MAFSPFAGQMVPFDRFRRHCHSGHSGLFWYTNGSKTLCTYCIQFEADPSPWRSMIHVLRKQCCSTQFNPLLSSFHNEEFMVSLNTEVPQYIYKDGSYVQNAQTIIPFRCQASPAVCFLPIYCNYTVQVLNCMPNTSFVVTERFLGETEFFAQETRNDATAVITNSYQFFTHFQPGQAMTRFVYRQEQSLRLTLVRYKDGAVLGAPVQFNIALRCSQSGLALEFDTTAGRLVDTGAHQAYVNLKKAERNAAEAHRAMLETRNRSLRAEEMLQEAERVWRTIRGSNNFPMQSLVDAYIPFQKQ